MDKIFLNKVVSQIVRETEIDYNGEMIILPPPFSFILTFSSRSLNSIARFTLTFSLFSNHCKEVYGLNEEETKYVWNEYKRIIKDKIRNNG